MNRYRVTVAKDGNLFAAAHFITYGRETAEPLHGHNYRVGATLGGPLDEHFLVFDFVRLKRELEAIAAGLDHRVLLATRNPTLPVEVDGSRVLVRSPAGTYAFPKSDVVLLEIANTTAELLAGWFADRLLERLGEASAHLDEIEIELEESPGQSALLHRRLRDRT